VSDNAPDGRTPLWGWVLIVIALAMFAALIFQTVGTGDSGR
jgi:hypothetical protein